MLGLANSAFALNYGDGNKTSTVVINDNYKYEPPYYEIFSGGETELGKLRNLIIGEEYTTSKLQYRQIILGPVAGLPLSKFQLIVDEGGNIIDCELVKSTKLNKDNLVLDFFPNSSFFISPGLLNGKPCKSIVIVSIGYYDHGSISFDLDSYPVMNLPDSELETADLNSSPNN